MQFIINDGLLGDLMNIPEALAQALIQDFSKASVSGENADIVLDIAQLTLQTNGPAILGKLAEFLGSLIQQNIPVAKIIVEDHWLTHPMMLKAHTLLNKLFPETHMTIYGKSGQVLKVETSYVPTMMVPERPSSDAPYSFYPNINMTVYRQHIAQRIAKPFTLNQGRLDACGVTAYLTQILETQPELYRKMALELADKGQSTWVVNLRAPNASLLTKGDEFCSSSSAVLLNAFQNPLSFLAQIGIPVEIVGWLETVIRGIVPNALSDYFNRFKLYALQDLAGKLANLPGQIVKYLSLSGYEVVKDSTRMLTMEFFKDILSQQKDKPGTEAILADVQRLTYSDIHSETPHDEDGLINELQDIESKLQNGHHAILLLETKWNLKITAGGLIDGGLSHYNYCKNLSLSHENGRNKVKMTLYTWAEKFDVTVNLSEFAKHYCGVILSKPKTLLFSKEPKSNMPERRSKRLSGLQAPEIKKERNKRMAIRDKSPKRR